MRMHIKKEDTGNTRPGYSQVAYIGIVSEMSAVPAHTNGVVSDDITFAAATPTNGFMEVYSLQNSPKMESTTTGEPGALSPNYTLDLFIPGDTAAVEQAMLRILNEPIIVLAQDGTEGGPVWMMGTLQNPAFFASKGFKSDTLKDGTKGHSFTIGSISKYEYSGTITELEE